MRFLEEGQAEKLEVKLPKRLRPNTKKKKQKPNSQQFSSTDAPRSRLSELKQNAPARDWKSQELKNPCRSDPAVQAGERAKKCLQDRHRFSSRARLALRPPLCYQTALSQLPHSCGESSRAVSGWRWGRPRATPIPPGRGASLTKPAHGRDRRGPGKWRGEPVSCARGRPVLAARHFQARKSARGDHDHSPGARRI